MSVRPISDPLPLSLSLATVLTRILARLASGDERGEGDLSDILEAALRHPPADETPLVRHARGLGLDPAEILCLHLLRRVETDPRLAETIGALQAGETRHRPSAALLAQIAQAVAARFDVDLLLKGPLFGLPLARTLQGTAPATLCPVALTEPMMAAFGLPSRVQFKPVAEPGSPPPAWAAHAAALASRLSRGRVALLLQTGLPGDQRLYADALAAALGRRAIYLPDGEDGEGLGPALGFAEALPVDTPEPKAGARARLPSLEAYGGPRVVLMGTEGGIDAPGWDVLDLALPPLSDGERERIWAAARRSSPADGASETTSASHEGLPLAGLGPARLTSIATRMKLGFADLPGKLAFRRAAGQEARPDLEPHGRIVGAEVGDGALVASPVLRTELELLARRCATRRSPRERLGPAFHARGPETGVRALLSGPSGSGKTLACSWIATRLAMPLFRVDLASVVSKYIGETEENLARILDRAEAADIILLFDEADSLFGSRTDVKDSSDRFANNQTNYLLSRIESYGGIVLMTTNSRDRIDGAFSRRIDQIIDVPVPDARERRSIWRAHLGEASALSGLELNKLASEADIAGGHIRSIVMTAAVLADDGDGPIGMAEIARALTLEYRKIGRTPPSSLARP